MSLIHLTDAWLSFSDVPLLDKAELHIDAKERICLVGRNGAGKSTLLKILSKEQPLDDGQLILAPDLVVSRLQQDPPRDIAGTVYDFVAGGIAQQAEILQGYHQLLQQVAQQPSDSHLKRLAELQEILDHQDLWRVENRIQMILDKLALTAETPLSALSGGWLRKAALARALVTMPDVLFLDEPTNHLDIETITWLETFLQEFDGSIVFISHDRAFIQAVATRIVDLDRGTLTSWPGDYEAYLQGKEEALRVEALQQAEFDKKLAQEEIWIRQGIKARRTRNEGRVRTLKALRQERRARRDVQGNVSMRIETASASGKLLFELENVVYQVEGKTLVRNFSAQVQRGDKIALIGPNGCGKTSLLKLMMGELTETSGKIRRGTRLEVAYFDQHRAELDPEKSVVDNLTGGKQEVIVNGRSRHVLGYLQDFLFPPKKSLTPVKALSGGERNRLLLARIFLKPSNLLILDEPTNDLDIETLELLEEPVEDYKGTVLLVSHDRQFVDDTVTDCWISEGDGVIQRYAGGYFDAHQQQQASLATRQSQLKPAARVTEKHTPAPAPTKKSNKLSYPLARELEQLPAKIEKLEQEIAVLQEQISHPQFFNQPQTVTQPVLSTLKQTEQQLETCFARWEALETQRNGLP